MVIQALLAASLAFSSVTAAPAAPKQATVDCAKLKCLALTFDDGPGPYTTTLLKTLKKAGAKATFFLVGKRVEERPEVARKILASGHAVGNHTYDHQSLISHSDDEILEEIKVTQEILEKVTGKRPTMFRPPYGNTNDTVLWAAAQTDVAQILWTDTTLDWSLKDPKKIKATILKLAKRNGVILMHDMEPGTVKVMPEVLKELKKQGYTFVTVPQLLRAKGGPKPGMSYF